MTVLVCIGKILKILYTNGTGYSAIGLWGILSILLIWHWVYFDAAAKNLHRSFSFGMNIQLYWPVLIPWYFYKTRGLKGLLIPIGLLLILIAPELCRLLAEGYR